MSGAALCAALMELGFDGEDPLDEDALEWPFQYEEARPLLAWICSCLRPSNVLSPSHLAQCSGILFRAMVVLVIAAEADFAVALLWYEQLVEEGRLLEGEDLDSAFDSISAFSSKKDNQEAVFGSEETILDIREAKLAYRAEVFELQKQLARQQAQFDLLAGQASTLIQGRRARVSAMSAVSGELISLDEILSSRNLEDYMEMQRNLFMDLLAHERNGYRRILSTDIKYYLSHITKKFYTVEFVSLRRRALRDC